MTFIRRLTDRKSGKAGKTDASAIPLSREAAEAALRDRRRAELYTPRIWL